MRKTFNFIDQDQGIANSIDNPDMLGPVAKVVTLLEKHVMTMCKQTQNLK